MPVSGPHAPVAAVAFSRCPKFLYKEYKNSKHYRSSTTLQVSAHIYIISILMIPSLYLISHWMVVYIYSANVIVILIYQEVIHTQFSTNMTTVPDDPALWPTINANRIFSYFTVAAFVVVTYDWALTLGQEVELIWVSGVWCQRNTRKYI
ncbi:uncharacterized protein HD556DRAFT_226458 [Suillus plorans]|uniref:DUF6533 domain-containing protein n=1 Tax=Suillus plorans TaxID=116603 RepID=A0A9P7J0M9_9AGAM|nr:uncharacterized protein HD556DRAFT_226458 [Suillus plorans]KAG1798195.1 hypothetical protein HD556DRAFT_226458 [Suillus plorans]